MNSKVDSPMISLMQFYINEVGPCHKECEVAYLVTLFHLEL